MNVHRFLAPLALTLLAAPVAAQTAPASPPAAAVAPSVGQHFVGRWTGSMQRGGTREPLELTIDQPGQVGGGSFSWRGLGYINAPILGSRVLEDGTLRVTLPLPLGSLRLIMKMEGSRLHGVLDESTLAAGQFKWLGEHGTVELQRSALPTRTSQAIPVAFESQGVQLKGSIHLPTGRGPFPAAVYVHGSGDVDRSDANLLAERLNAKGIALLAYDKRGVGESQGDWKTSSLEILAADANAALEALKRRPEVDVRRLGYIGRSQGGWIVPIALRRSGAAFAAFISGPTVSAADEDIDHYVHVFREAGMTDVEFARAEKLLRLHHQAMRGKLPLSALRSAAAREAKARWFELLNFEELQKNVNDFDRAWVGYDPESDLKRLTVPTLWLYGSEDRIIPVEASIVRLLRLKLPVRPAIQVLPGGDHALAVVNYPALPGGVPSAFDKIADWINAQGE